MRTIYLAFFLFLFKLNYSINKDTLARVDCLELRSLNDIIMADTSIVYDCIHVYEHDSIIHGIEKLDKFHTLDFEYEGNLRKYFPVYANNITRYFNKVEIVGKKLQDMPSFVKYDSLVFLLIEARNIKIKFDISKCLKLEHLYLICKEPYNYLEEVCQLKKLIGLGIGERPIKVINSLGCLKNLENLESLSIDLNRNNLSELSVLKKLKEIGFENKIYYEDVINNLKLFETYEHISFLNFIGTNKEKEEIKKKLQKRIWSYSL